MASQYENAELWYLFSRLHLANVRTLIKPSVKDENLLPLLGGGVFACHSLQATFAFHILFKGRKEKILSEYWIFRNCFPRRFEFVNSNQHFIKSDHSLIFQPCGSSTSSRLRMEGHFVPAICMIIYSVGFHSSREYVVVNMYNTRMNIRLKPQECKLTLTHLLNPVEQTHSSIWMGNLQTMYGITDVDMKRTLFNNAEQNRFVLFSVIIKCN